MSDVSMYADSSVSRSRKVAIWAILIATGAAGIALKMPFGRFMLHLMGKAAPAHQSWAHLLFASEWGWLFLAAIGTLLVYDRSGLVVAPQLRRFLYPDLRVGNRPMVWRPALLGGLVCLGFFVLHTLFGPQALQAGFGHLSHADQMKMLMLYPFADLGAGLSEEVIYRFGIIGTLMGLFSFAAVGGRNANNSIAFWIANFAQAAFFGFIHVQQGVVASQSGGIVLATAISAPTWSGVVLGYVFRRWGIEAAILAHIAGDIFVPIFWTLWSALHH